MIHKLIFSLSYFVVQPIFLSFCSVFLIQHVFLYVFSLAPINYYQNKRLFLIKGILIDNSLKQNKQTA